MGANLIPVTLAENGVGVNVESGLFKPEHVIGSKIQLLMRDSETGE